MVNEGRQIAAARSCGITQIDNRHLIAVALGGNGPIIAGQIPLSIQRQKAHTASAVVFAIGI